MKRISPYWLTAFVAFLLALTILVPGGSYWLQLESQRRLQDRITKDGRYWFIEHDHWLAEWLPAPLARRLPGADLHVTLMFEDGEPFSQDLARLGSIRHLELSSVEYPVLMDLVTPIRSLEELKLENATISDQDLARLALLRKLETLKIEDTPVTDACLAHLASVPSLKRLYLYKTKVTRPAIVAFASAHPQIAVGWKPPLTAEQLQGIRALEERGIEVGSVDEDFIVTSLDWRVRFSKPEISDSDVECLLSLGGKLRSIRFDPLRPDGKQLRLADIDQLKRLCSETLIDCVEPQSAEIIDALAALPGVIEVEFRGREMSAQTLERLQAKWGKKLTQSDVAYVCYR